MKKTSSMQLKLTLIALLAYIPFAAAATGGNGSGNEPPAYIPDASASDAPLCSWNGDSLSLGESVWVEDSFLVTALKVRLSNAGYSDEKIEYEASHNDWTGYRVECIAQVTLNPNPDGPGDILRQDKGVMVINDNGREFHQNVIDSQ